MDKSPEAFRTISEVADLLETPAHVLRFWESRFPQIRPVKRAGGRRYYRPADVALLSGIKHLLHDEGLTIRGVQKMLREQGVRHVSGIVGDAHVFEEDAETALEAALSANFPEEIIALPAEPETAQIVALETALRKVPARTEDKPVQENLFADLFDAAPPSLERPPEPAPEPLFAEVTEALAGFIGEPPPPEDAPEAPMIIDADEDDVPVSDRVVAMAPAPNLARSDAPALGDSAGIPDAGHADAEPLRPISAASLAARIAAAPRPRMVAHRETLRTLRDRLIVLEDRMISPRY